MNTIFIFIILCAPTGFSSEENEPLVLVRKKEEYSFPSIYSYPINNNLEYFCPKEMSTEDRFEEQYLIPVGKEGLSCEKPVKPSLKKSSQLNISCGIDGNSNYYDFIYKLQINYEKNREKKRKLKKYQDLLLYRICYDDKKKETIYTYYPMISPDLLESHYLNTQRSTVYKIDSDHYNSILVTDYLETAYKNKNSWIKKNLLRLNNLQPLLLSSPDDPPFSVLKKPFYNYLNSKPAWKSVINMWNIINKYLKNMAIQVANYIKLKTKSDYKRIDMIQMSGWMGHLKLEENLIYLDEEKKKIPVPKSYWKLVYNPKTNNVFAIILHNLPDKKYQDSDTKLSCTEDQQQKRIGELKLIDNKYDWDTFVQFCDHKIITDLYQLPEKLNFLLQTGYLLPLVLASDQGEYRFPETYHGLEKSFGSHTEKQFFFCPTRTKLKEDSQERCLLPNETRNPYCKDPVEYSVLNSQRLNIECPNYRLRDIAYRICNEDEQTAIKSISKVIV